MRCVKDSEPCVLRSARLAFSADKSSPDGVTSLYLHVVDLVRGYLNSDQLSPKEQEHLRASLEKLEKKVKLRCWTFRGCEYIGEVSTLAQDMLHQQQ